jgi:hypothetical protein
MSRKRKAKKERKKQSRLHDELHALRARGEWLEIIALSNRKVANPTASEHAGIYLEAVDRALVAALKAGDLQGAGKLVQQLSQVSSPLVKLSGAVTSMIDGDLEAAVVLLEDAATDPAAGTGVCPDLNQVTSSLMMLCQPAGKRRIRAKTLPAAVDLRRLDRGLSKLYGGGTPPKNIGLSTPPAVAVWNLARTLEAVAARDYRPDARHLSSLKEVATQLEQGRHGSALREVAAIIRLIGLITTAVSDSKLLSSHKPGPRFALFTKMVDAGRYRELGKQLGVSHEPGHLCHLQHLLRVTWGDLIQLATNGEQPHLDALTAEPSLFAGGVLQCHGAGARNPYIASQQRVYAQLFLYSHNWTDLSELLAEESVAEPDAGRLATLWAVQLELALIRLDEDDEDDDEDDDYPDNDWDEWDDPEKPKEDAHTLFLFPFLTMVRAMRGRTPVAQQTVVARFLRDQLLSALTRIEVCGHFGEAAETLLAYLPQDLPLLMLTLAGFESAGDIRGMVRIRQHIAAMSRVTVVDIEAVDSVVRELLHDMDLEEVVEVLSIVRPLVPETTWHELLQPSAALVAQDIVTMISFAEAHGIDDWGPVSDLVETIEQVWEETLPVAAAKLTFACCRGKRRKQIEALIEQFQEVHHDLKANLLLYGMLGRATENLRSASVQRKALQILAGWIVDNLTPDWRLWLPALLPLVAEVKEPSRLIHLNTLILGVLESDQLDPRARLVLGHAHEQLQRKIGKQLKKQAQPKRGARARKPLQGKQRQQQKPGKKKQKKPQQPVKEKDPYEDIQMAFDWD